MGNATKFMKDSGEPSKPDNDIVHDLSADLRKHHLVHGFIRSLKVTNIVPNEVSELCIDHLGDIGIKSQTEIYIEWKSDMEEKQKFCSFLFLVCLQCISYQIHTQHKVTILGGTGVGKTSCLGVLIYDDFKYTARSIHC